MSNTVTTRGKGGDAGQTRQAVIEASRRLFARYGHAKTSVGEIAREAGLCKATVYNHFRGGKEQIIAEVMRYERGVLMEKVRRAVRTADGPVDALRAFFMTRVREIQRLQNVYHAERGDFIRFMPLVARLIDESRREESLLLRRVLEEGVEAGVFRTFKDAGMAAEVLFSAVLSITFPLTGESGRPAARRLETFIDMILAGIRTGRCGARATNKEKP